MAAKYHPTGNDLYRILRISQTATIEEIKISYRQLAMELHPDKHNGCPNKLEKFKEIKEAYEILIDKSKRKEYDFKHFGVRYNKNRSSPLPKDYRKVYAPRPPPDWKMTWDHDKHYDMHYGDGFLKEALEEAKRRAKRDGTLDYQSPLGKGFSFSFEPGAENDNFNPFSKSSRQGPPKFSFVYEDGEMSELAPRARNVPREAQIVKNLHERRNLRHSQQELYKQQKQESESSSKFYPMGAAAQKVAMDQSQADGCVIL